MTAVELITADQVRDATWQTLQHVPFEQGGWGRLQESVEFPELQLKTWRTTRRDPVRGAFLVRGHALAVHHLPEGDFRFPEDVYALAAAMLTACRSERAA